MSSIPSDLQRITASPEDNDVDEIVIASVDIHLERMSDGSVWFALYRPGNDTRLSFWLTAERRGDLRVAAYWDGSRPWSDVSHEVRRHFHIADDDS